MPEPLVIEFPVAGMDFKSAGEGSSKLKRTLQEIGLGHAVVRRCAVCAYEAEMNIVIHAWRGTIRACITPDAVEIVSQDEGPGIPDIELAMKEGYSTAPAHIREMGFGAGMGLPNMNRCSDKMEVKSHVGKGTWVRMMIRIPKDNRHP
ncbi:MAG: ATP-binding protein [Ignavibacteriales bacterium]